MDIKETLQTFSSKSFTERQDFLVKEGDWLLQQTLTHIGSTNAELRDLIYRTFIDILSDNLLSPQQLQFLFDTTTNEDFFIC